MMSKIMYTLIFSTQLVMQVTASDFNTLEGIGERFSRKISSETSISRETITTDLKRLYRIAERNTDYYAPPEKFQKLYDEKISEMHHDQKFLNFATLCKEIYEQSTLPKDRAALYIFFDKVSDKCRMYFVLQQQRYKPSSWPSKEELKRTVEEFSNIDKRKDPPSDARPIITK